MPKSGFVLYLDYKKHFDLIQDDTDFRRLIEAIFAYCETGTEPSDLSPVALMAFSFIRANLDRDSDKYEAVKEKRKEAGRLGGLAKASNARKAKNVLAKASNANDCLANLAVNVTVNDTVNDINTDTLSECMSGQSPDDPSRQEDSESEGHAGKRPACPVKEIVAMYHDILPEHPRVEIINAHRRGAINARWADIGNRLKDTGREDSREARLEYMRHVFRRVARSSFLTGKAVCRDGKTYMATFDMLMRPNGFAGVIEGKYDDRG